MAVETAASYQWNLTNDKLLLEYDFLWDVDWWRCWIFQVLKWTRTVLMWFMAIHCNKLRDNAILGKSTLWCRSMELVRTMNRNEKFDSLTVWNEIVLRYRIFTCTALLRHKLSQKNWKDPASICRNRQRKTEIHTKLWFC